jgi:hypothetical protein
MVSDSLVVTKGKTKNNKGGKDKVIEREPVQTSDARGNSGTTDSEALPGGRAKRAAAVQALHAIKASSSSSQPLHANHYNQPQDRRTDVPTVRVSPKKKVARGGPGSRKEGIEEMRAVDFVP